MNIHCYVKKIVLIIAVISLSFGQDLFSNVYTYSPALNTWATEGCTVGTVSLLKIDYYNCSYTSPVQMQTYDQNPAKFKLASQNASTGALTFTFQKCLSTFQSSGKVIIENAGTYWCTSYSSGASSISITVNIGNFTGLKSFSGFIVSSAQQTWLFTGYINVTGVAAPVVQTSLAQYVSNSSMNLFGNINGNYGNTTYYFEYGLSTGYGSQSSTSTLSPVNGSTSVNKVISGLSQNIEYHYRLVASNQAGTTYGADATFVINDPITLNSPGSSVSPGPVLTTLAPVFSWNPITGGNGYVLQIVKVSNNSVVFNENIGNVTSFPLAAGILSASTAYYWRVATTVAGYYVISVNYYFQTPLIVSTPTFDPSGGVFTIAQMVALTCGTSGATIRYTLDGTEPNTTSLPYTSPINVYTTMTVKAKGFLTGYVASNVGSASYTINIPVLCDFPDCNSTINCGNPGYAAETYLATQYLCTHHIVEGVNGYAQPDNDILRQQLAKIALLGIYLDGNNLPVTLPSDYFPSPYNDLQNTATYYYRYAKALLYLQDNNDVNGITPFDRDRYNFYPSNYIVRIHVLKVLLESFNIPPDNTGPSPFLDVPTTDPNYGYVKAAANLGIVNTTNDYFYPTTNCTRGQAFIFLYRILSLINSGQLNAPNPQSTDFFYPGLYSPYALAGTKNQETGNFNHYTKTSFSMPGKKLSLDFGFSYNSYLTELQDEFFPVQPLGSGWSHSYNSYIVFVPGTTTSEDRWIANWPDGSSNVYYKENNYYRRETKGVYDTLIYNTSLKFTIETKDKVSFCYQKISSDEIAFMLTSITDRNGNTITISYIPGPTVSWFGINKPTRKIYSVSDPSGRSLNFNYTPSSSSLLTGVTDPLGRNISFSYSNGLLSSSTDAKNQVTYYEYGSTRMEFNLLKTITLPKGNTVNNTYTQRKLLSTKYNSNSPTTIALNTANYAIPNSNEFLKSTVVDPAGVVQKFDFNSLGQPTHAFGNIATDISCSYGNPSHPTLPGTVVNNKNGISAVITYDPKGNPLQVVSQGGGISITETYQYNSFNDVTQYTDGKGQTTYYTYNSTGNLSQIKDPLDNTVNITNNTAGQIVSMANPVGVITNMGYNTYGNLNSVSLPILGVSSSSVYDAASRLISTTNFSGQVTSYLYDNNDNLTRETNALLFQRNNTFDANDNLTVISNAKEIPTNMTFDAYDRLTGVSFAGSAKSYSYNTNGTQNTYTNPNGHIFTYSYDAAGRITSDGYAAYSYDATTGSLKTIVKDGKTLTYNYDGLNRVSSISFNDFTGNTVFYTYDNNNNLTTMQYPGNRTVTYTYDAINQLTQVSDWNNTITTYSYRPDGQLSSMTYPNLVKCIYSYDNAARMTGIAFKRNNGSGSTIASYTFTLDNLGNHTQEQITEPYTYYPAKSAESVNYSYNDANRILTAGGTSFSYDNNGNTLSKTGYNYTYDYKDNITSISGNYSQTYEYDGLGNRRKKGNTRFVLDILGMSRLLMETDLTGNVQNYYIYGLALISRIASSNATSYYISDFRGSIVAMTDATVTANITHQYQYDDFGNITQVSEANSNPFRFVGKYGVMYEDGKNYFMRARYYDPQIGRFLSEDPVWGTNRYVYSDNNPIGKFDLSGQVDSWCTEITAGYLNWTRDNWNGDAITWDNEENPVMRNNGFTQITADELKNRYSICGKNPFEKENDIVFIYNNWKPNTVAGHVAIVRNIGLNKKNEIYYERLDNVRKDSEFKTRAVQYDGYYNKGGKYVFAKLDGRWTNSMVLQPIQQITIWFKPKQYQCK